MNITSTFEADDFLLFPLLKKILSVTYGAYSASTLFMGRKVRWRHNFRNILLPIFISVFNQLGAQNLF